MKIRRPKKLALNDELQWFGTSLGLFGERDRDKSCFRLFIELLKATKMGQGLSSDELAMRLKLTRPTVLHHLSTLQKRGLIIHERKRYWLRDDNLEQLLATVKREMDETMQELEKAAKDIDQVLQL